MPIKRKNKYRIGDLAKKAGVSAPTVRHYLKEGLIQKPVKTGKTMAYYDESCVERIKLIKKLQRERFLPLNVIKRIIDSGEFQEDELEVGKAMFKPNGLLPDQITVPETKIEAHTGYPLSKILILENEGMISPVTDGGKKIYGNVDIEIINIMKKREEAGVPFDHCVEIAKAYRDGIDSSVKRDLKIFVTSILGDVSAKNAARMMTEADESLDRFILIYRRNLVRKLASESVKSMDSISDLKDSILFLPKDKEALKYIPKTPEPGLFGVCQSLLKGDFSQALKLLENKKNNDESPCDDSFIVLALLLSGDIDKGFSLASSLWPEPTGRPLENTVAALACVFALSQAKGLSSPAYLIKKTVSYLARIYSGPLNGDLEGALACYVCGMVYVLLPNYFDTVPAGVSMLSRLAGSLAKGNININDYPAWTKDLLQYRIFPEVEALTNRYLAEGNMRMGKTKSAGMALERLIAVSSSESDHFKWARKMKLEMKF